MRCTNTLISPCLWPGTIAFTWLSMVVDRLLPGFGLVCHIIPFGEYFELIGFYLFILFPIFLYKKNYFIYLIFYWSMLL
jgi:hypothetical protein